MMVIDAEGIYDWERGEPEGAAVGEIESAKHNTDSLTIQTLRICKRCGVGVEINQVFVGWHEPFCRYRQ